MRDVWIAGCSDLTEGFTVRIDHKTPTFRMEFGLTACPLETCQEQRIFFL